MARIRTIKPEFWSNDRLSELPVETHMFAAALLNYCDDEGYFHAHEKKLGIELFPLRDDYRSSTVHLQHLSRVGFITLHKGSDDRTYGHVSKFKQHQVINKPSPSKIKHLVIVSESLRDDYGSATVVLPNGTGNMEQGIRNMEVEKEKEKEVGKKLPQKNLRAARFTEFWEAYPATDRRTAKKQCLEKWQKNNLDEQADLIIAHLYEMRRTEQWRSGFEPAALTYLNQQRWDGFGDGMLIPNRSNPENQNKVTMQHSKPDLEEQAKRISKMLANKSVINNQEF